MSREQALSDLLNIFGALSLASIVRRFPPCFRASNTPNVNAERKGRVCMPATTSLLVVLRLEAPISTMLLETIQRMQLMGSQMVFKGKSSQKTDEDDIDQCYQL
jgi:hypothetical protein